MKVSVIIPTLNEEKCLPRLLESVREQTMKPYEVLIVDGGSTDKTKACIVNYTGVTWVQADGLPVGAARNRGAKEATGDILAFIDADCRLDKNWVREIEEGMRRRTVGLIGATFPDDGEEVDKLAYSLRRNSQKLSLLFYLPFDPGFNCAYRKDAFNETDGFNKEREFNEGVRFSFSIRGKGNVRFNSRIIAYANTRRIQAYGYTYLTIWQTAAWAQYLLTGTTPKYPRVR